VRTCVVWKSMSHFSVVQEFIRLKMKWRLLDRCAGRHLLYDGLRLTLRLAESRSSGRPCGGASFK
jgi:hypothetical protein